MSSIKKHQGVGMIEVLVALTLLAVGVLGFTALQLRAVDATTEANNRIQAMNLARDLAERIRANQVGLSKNIVVKDEDGKDTDKKISAYIKAFIGKESLDEYTWRNCYQNNKCTSEILAAQDASQILYKAGAMGMKVGLSDCAGSLQRERNCIYVAWGDTSPNDGNGSGNCTKNGSYTSASQCIVLEAY
ncbi:type IV pilus modification protein PilV [Alkanindiges sp. WGS2144]|uniref:type IV pilus modification protein PilV n=1 Tax=Alkanindiges sp. WGS2144 TaxID=3366808 RepID=UPI0037534AC7